jgi:hypothetical protein
MAARITPRLIELTYEAALKSFWRKQALRSFLRSCGVPEPVIASWAPDESKRDFLDRAFNNLRATDRGKATIFAMARHLSEQSSFADLRDWEDSKDKIAEATRAVTELKAYLGEQDAQIKSERESEEAKTRARAEPVRLPM